jgi:hypothetical protein
MKKDLTKVKTRLIELGYIDNEWLDKYLEIIEANLNTKKSKESTQAHHAIPVNDYWISAEPYNRNEALKLARRDPVNFEVNLLYKDHLLIHSYLTLCTDLDKVQQKYEAQEDLRRKNSIKARALRTTYPSLGTSNKRKVGMMYKCRAVKCIELDQIFNSAAEAARVLGISHSGILKCLSKRCYTAGKYHWAYLDADNLN